MCEDESADAETLTGLQADVEALAERIGGLVDQLTAMLRALTERVDRLEADMNGWRLDVEAILASMPRDDDFEERVNEIMEIEDALDL